MKKQSRQQNATKEVGGYLLGKDLGSGTFGKVKLGTHTNTGENVAIKVLEKNKICDISDMDRVLRQIHILKLVRHPNIVQLYDIVQTPKKLMLVMEYMQRGELFDQIVRNKRIDEQEACRLFHQLIDGIQHIHKIGIAHRDLKPQNLLLDYRNNLKIVDFGLSNTYKRSERLRTPCGSQSYAAPEMLQGQPYQGIKIDIWAAGVILFAMLCGYLPFEQQNDVNALYDKILGGQFKIHQSVSETAQDLIHKILNVNAQHRYTIQEIRKHPWMTMNCPKNISAHSRGIIIGYNRIPIDSLVLKSLRDYGLTIDELQKTENNLQANGHNKLTTTYYLAFKKLLKSGGESEYDIENLNFNWKIVEPVNSRNKRQIKDTKKILIDTFFTKENEPSERSKWNKQKHAPKRKSREKSCEGILFQSKEMTSRTKISQKQNIALNINVQKRQRVNSKPSTKVDPRIQNSINYGRVSLGDGDTFQPVSKHKANKSTEKSVPNHRDSHFDNRLSRKYKQKFNQSLVTHSKDKSRYCANSSIHSNILINKSKTKIDNNSKIGKNQIYETSQIIQQSFKHNKECGNRNKRANSRKGGCSQVIKSDLMKVLKSRWI